MSKEMKKVAKDLKRTLKECKRVLTRYFNFKGGLFKKEMNDEKYQKLVEKRKENWDVFNKAVAKLGVDVETEKTEAIGFSGYYFDEASLRKNCFSSKYQVCWLLFCEEQVMVYDFVFDMLSTFASETTYEFFYEDITTFSTIDQITQDPTIVNNSIREAAPIQKKDKNVKRIPASFVVSSKFKIVAQGESFVYALTSTPETEEKIKKIKLLLRSRKSKNVLLPNQNILNEYSVSNIETNNNNTETHNNNAELAMNEETLRKVGLTINEEILRKADQNNEEFLKKAALNNEEILKSVELAVKSEFAKKSEFVRRPKRAKIEGNEEGDEISQLERNIRILQDNLQMDE